MSKKNKTSFIIVRVTDTEKVNLKSMAIKSEKKFSKFIRNLLGLE